MKPIDSQARKRNRSHTVRFEDSVRTNCAVFCGTNFA